MNVNVRTVIIKLNLGFLLPKYHLVINKILFANDVKLNKSPDLLVLIHRLCIRTRVKMTFKDEDEKDELLIFWRFFPNLTTLPHFESDLISVINEKDDSRKFKFLNQNKNFKLIGTNTVSVLSPPELLYLKHTMDQYLNRKKPIGEVEILEIG